MNNYWNPIFFLNRQLDVLLPESDVAQGNFIKKLDWDSAYFNADIYKLDFIQDGMPSSEFKAFLPEKKTGRKTYIFSEVPTEAISVFRLLGEHEFSLIETRLTYFHLLEQLPEMTRYCRPAGAADLPFLKKTASGAVNPFDRYHSDPFFSEQEASSYLETYIESCLNGFSEIVFVPDLNSSPASFAAISKLNLPDKTVYRIPLTAALPDNKGWHYHLCLSALHYAKNKQANALIMTTQSGNSAVIHNCEKLGFKLGSTFHIFAREL